MSSNWCTILFLLVFVIASVTVPSSAFSFSSWFGDDDDDSSSQERNPTGLSASDSGSVGLSNRTNIKPRQPILYAVDWFLTEQEITDSRGGVPRDDMAVYSTGNKVTFYTVAKEFYDAVYDDLSVTKKGDYVMFAAWLTALVPLKPDIDPTGAKTGIRNVFAGVVERGGNVSVLNWASIAGGYIPFNIKARDAINSIPSSPTNKARAMLFLMTASTSYPLTTRKH